MNTEFNGKQYTMEVQTDGKITLVPVVADDGALGVGCEYHVVRSDGSTSYHLFDNDSDDKDFVAFNNAFRTKDEAIKASALMRRSNAIIRACLLVDAEAGVHGIGRNHASSMRDGEWFADSYGLGGIWHALTCCVHTRDQAERAAALLNKWGVK